MKQLPMFNEPIFIEEIDQLCDCQLSELEQLLKAMEGEIHYEKR